MYQLIKSLSVQTSVHSVLNRSFSNSPHKNVVPIKHCFYPELTKNIINNKKTIEDKDIYITLANVSIMFGGTMLFKNDNFGLFLICGGTLFALDSNNHVIKSKTYLKDIKKSCELNQIYKCTCINERIIN
jgi:hypothetical protein